MNFDERMISEHEAELNLYASMLDLMQNGDIVEDFENPQVQERILKMKNAVSKAYDEVEVLLNGE
jgi:hypothetical protein